MSHCMVLLRVISIFLYFSVLQGSFAAGPESCGSLLERISELIRQGIGPEEALRRVMAEDSADTVPPGRVRPDSQLPVRASSLPPPAPSRPLTIQTVPRAGIHVLVNRGSASVVVENGETVHVIPEGWGFIEDRTAPSVSFDEITRRVGAVDSARVTEIRRALGEEGEHSFEIPGRFIHYPEIRYRPLREGETARQRVERVLGRRPGRLQEILDSSGRPPGSMFRVFIDLDHPGQVIKVLDPTLMNHDATTLAENLQRTLAYRPIHQEIGLDPFQIYNPVVTRNRGGHQVTSYEYVDQGILIVERIEGESALGILDVRRLPGITRDSSRSLRSTRPPPATLPPQPPLPSVPPPALDADLRAVLTFWEHGDRYDALFRNLDMGRYNWSLGRNYGLADNPLRLEQERFGVGIDRGVGNVVLQVGLDPNTGEPIRRIRLRDF